MKEKIYYNSDGKISSYLKPAFDSNTWWNGTGYEFEPMKYDHAIQRDGEGYKTQYYIRLPPSKEGYQILFGNNSNEFLLLEGEYWSNNW